MRARVTLHRFALNCDPDLAWFDGIVACGLPDHGVTSLSALVGRPITAGEARPLIERHFAGVFDLAFEPAPPEVGPCSRRPRWPPESGRSGPPDRILARGAPRYQLRRIGSGRTH
jgi:hypothetical protein